MDISSHLGRRVMVCLGCAHLCPQSSFIHVGCEIAPLCRGFQSTVCDYFIANESSRMLFVAQFSFSITFKPWLSARTFGNYCPRWSCCAHNVSALKRQNVRFPNCRENQVKFTRTKKKHWSIVCNATLTRFFSSLFSMVFFFSLSLLNDFFFYFPSPQAPLPLR